MRSTHSRAFESGRYNPANARFWPPADVQQCLLLAASSTGRRNTSLSYRQGFEGSGIPATWLNNNPMLPKYD